MAENTEPHVDSVTGIPTTGHEWDGIRELNQPLPRWWLWIFYATIIFSLGYWVVYPSWPLVTSHTNGFFGWNSRTAVLEDLEGLETLRGPMVQKLTETPLADVQADAELFDFTLAFGKAAFGDNCAPCHGAGGGGAVGYANLVDDDWLWGGAIDEIHHTIAYGVRNENEDSRIGDMLAFGRDEILTSQEIYDVAGYVMTLSGGEAPAGSDPEVGATIYVENCADCHGEDGSGIKDFGSANLTDAIGLYGNDFDSVLETITNGRAGAMPAWEERLGPTTVKALAVYVHALGGGE